VDVCSRKAILKRARDISRIEYGVTPVFNTFHRAKDAQHAKKIFSCKAVIAAPANKVKPFSSSFD